MIPLQSDEGRRFYQEQKRCVVRGVGDDFSVEVCECCFRMTLDQAKELIKFNNYFIVDGRSLIASISLI